MTHTDSGALSGLEQCSRHDLPRYKAAINQTRRICWQSYYPFLYFQGQQRSNQFLIGEDAGSICIYRLRFEGDSSTLMLFQLPMPFQPDVLERCLQRTMDHNKTSKVSIFRIDGEDAGLFRPRPNTRLGTCPPDYIYAPENYRDLSGGSKSNLRCYANKFSRNADVEVSDYQPDDMLGCLAVMERWTAIQKSKYEDILFHGYTRACLRQYERFPRQDLFGKVIRIGGEICSFGFAGEMRSGLGNLFITYSDHHHNGLNTYLNLVLLGVMDGVALVNGSNTGGEAGLAHAKQALGPVSLHTLFQVYIDAPVSVSLRQASTMMPIPSVNDHDGTRNLRLGTQWKQGIMRLSAPDDLVFEYTQRMMAWLLFVAPESVGQRHAMQLGLGAASLTKFCCNTLSMRTTAIELNHQVIAVCRLSFALPDDDEKLRVIQGDAREAVIDTHRHATVDALQVDIYDADAPLFDDEAFYANCRLLLTQDGILILNIFGRKSNVPETLEKVGSAFGRIAVWSFESTRSGNTVVLAQHRPSRPTENELATRAEEIQSRWGLPAHNWLKLLKPLVAQRA